MKTAKDYARAAAELTQFAERMKPAATSPYAAVENLIVYHIRSAASDARKISEAIAAKEGTDADA